MGKCSSGVTGVVTGIQHICNEYTSFTLHDHLICTTQSSIHVTASLVLILIGSKNPTHQSINQLVIPTDLQPAQDRIARLKEIMGLLTKKLLGRTTPPLTPQPPQPVLPEPPVMEESHQLKLLKTPFIYQGGNFFCEHPPQLNCVC